MVKRLVLFVFFGLMCNPFCSFSQDRITTADNITEEKEIQFQEFFFKALTEKSISNYEKAIENLEICTTILPKNKTVFFELSKNYLLLNRTIEAKEYIELALELEPTNIWMLLHLVAIQKKDRNYKEAIKTQLKVVEQNSNQQKTLIRLYYLNGEYSKALSLLNSLEKEIGLNKPLRQLKNNLERTKKTSTETAPQNDLSSLITDFENQQSSFFKVKKILEISIETDSITFYKYSELAIDLFPAQPSIYLYRGKALQMQQRYQEAINILEEGIDFVVDNSTLEAQFYTILAEVYTRTGRPKKAMEYLEKIKKLKR